MCGIAGYVGLTPPSDARVAACLGAMARRGPDHAAARVWHPRPDRHVVLLHSRLSIVDLDPRAHQPMGRDGRWIATNAELYNYRELREELAATGQVFATESDTEVFLAAVARWGWDALEHCEGMWAFAAYDEADGALVLGRDRFGEKPLLLARDAGGLYFGSEVKFLTALMGRSPRPDLAQVRRYLVHGYRALHKSTATFHDGVEALPPGHLLRIDAGGGERLTRFWRLRVEPDEGMGLDEAVKGVRERLFRAVELRLRADVPVAFCLSGGLDSTSLAAIARRVLGYDVEAFTVRLDDPRYDEREAVDASVRALGLRHHYVEAERADFLGRLRALVAQHDGPVSTISYYLHWHVMAAMHARGLRVSISGTGADELFAGYYDHHLAFLYEARGEPARLAAARADWERHVRPFVRSAVLRDPELFVRRPGFRDHLWAEGEGFLREPWAEPFTEETVSGDLLRNRMANELLHEVVPVILRHDDLNAMAFSIENRSPFLDRDLVEFAFRIPTRRLIRDGFSKAVLRDAVRGIVPDVVVDARRKVGFNAAIEELVDLGSAAVRQAVLADSPVYELVDRARVAALLEKGTLDNRESKFLFSLLNVTTFLEARA